MLTVSRTTYDVITFLICITQNSWISPERKKICQKGKRPSSWLAQLVECQSALQDFEGSSPRADQHSGSWSGTIIIKLFPLDFLGELHRIPRKNKNTVYHLQISVLAPEIFKFEKCVKYANEMTDDVIHSTQFYIKYINRDILVNLQRRPLKLGRPIGLQEKYLWL